ncbi:ATPase family associated with various cellular activities (AAA) [Duganella sp. CF517]|uniref:ATP-binding protein n=1 Tax=Duganella sp. CF517 TaxID=1881038 RepID=UPI0008C91C0E|nr:ATP-binding protein [Duganella sp. CF517]SEN77231.1 ATPase family associated with various cellular activities (AAA) [Duganella sp. CF517]
MSTGANPIDAAAMQANALSLEREIAWFTRLLNQRIETYFAHEDTAMGQTAPTPPDVSDDPSLYAQTVRESGAGGMSPDERVVLLLALLPSLRPQTLDLLLTRNKLIDSIFTEFGGLRGQTHNGFLPTCETALFILAGDDQLRRFELMRMFEPDHFFAQKNMVCMLPPEHGEPMPRAAIVAEPTYLQRFTTGQQQKPDFGAGFPAKRMVTAMEWDDLVVAHEVKDELDQIRSWMRGGAGLLHRLGLDRMVKPGYRTLFYGPPGTGKTLAATLLGKDAGVDVYRIDLSMLVSKYIGETEKNLANVFDQAQNKNWILFFDEADALFGKRTEGSSSNDRHANQEIAYLLQRVEDFPGVVILATNLRSNMDEAFARRFQSAIHFPLPDGPQRALLWQKLFTDRTILAPDVRLEALADAHVLAGGALLNVAVSAAIRAERRAKPGQSIRITNDDLLRAIKKEFIKEGRTL